MRGERLVNRIDWTTAFVYLALVAGGWFNIYAAEYELDITQGIFSFSMSSGRQLIWIGSSIVLIAIVLVIDYRFYESFAYIIYGLALFLLVAVLFLGKEVSGSQSWFAIGGFGIQPAEFAKIAAALALAKFLSSGQKQQIESKRLLISAAVFVFPALLIVLQGDTGSAMVYFSLIIVLFREGMSPMLIAAGASLVLLFVLTLLVNQLALLIGIVVVGLIAMGLVARNAKSTLAITAAIVISIGLVLSVDFVLNDVLRPHQQKRVLSLINPNADPLGVGWNVTQSKIAIGSGGLSGKGFLNGTQTKFDFVPEQTTDFIFCTIGEEHGWIGSSLLIVGFVILFLRILSIAERQKSNFVRIYGYGVLSILFFHFSINIAMTIGLFPVIGIPLPFFSYGGSSLWTFSILLFLLLKLDAHRMQVLQRF